MRSPRITRRVALVTLLALLGTAGAAAGESPVDRDLWQAGLRDIPLAERLEAARRALASDSPLPSDGALRAALSLLGEEFDVAAALARRGTSHEVPDPGLVAEVLTALRDLPAVDGVLQGRRLALRLSLGDRGALEEGGGLALAVHQRDPFVSEVLAEEIGTPADAGDEAVAGALWDAAPAMRALDRATRDDAAEAFAGLDALLALGGDALPLLLHEARLGVRGTPVARMPRVARALTVLGRLGDRRATESLLEALAQSPDGWVRLAAATALGDLRDPAAAVALAWHLCNLGDPHRLRDQWEYPGTSATEVAADAWRQVDYFVIDVAVADALLGLGVPGAAGYLVHEKLDPRRAWYRIRVLQDATDALRRHAPALLGEGYPVDGGIPQREAAFQRMARAWHAERGRLVRSGPPLDPADPAFAPRALELARRLRGASVRERLVGRATCALLGPAVTPSLLVALGEASQPQEKMDILRTLGDVRDAAAVPGLLGALGDPSPAVRGAAAEGLRAYAASDPAAVAALIRLLDDPAEEARTGAMLGLVGAPREDRVREAVLRHATQEPRSDDYVRAEAVVLFVQEGEARWGPIEEGLRAKHVFVRRTWWDLLRPALDLAPFEHDSTALPDAPYARRLGRERVLMAWKERHGR